MGAIDELRFEPTGDLQGDLTVLGEMFISGLRSGALDLQLRLTADAREHPELYRAMQGRVARPMSIALQDAFLAAQESGQVRAGDVAWLVRAFVGALMSRTFEQSSRDAPSSEDLQALTIEVGKWSRP